MSSGYLDAAKPYFKLVRKRSHNAGLHQKRYQGSRTVKLRRKVTHHLH